MSGFESLQRAVVAAFAIAFLASAANAADYLAPAGRGATFAIVGTEGTARRSTDGALTSTPATVSPATASAFRDVVDTGQAFVAVGDNGVIYASNLAGSSWNAGSSPALNALHSVSVIGSSLVAAGAGGTIFQSFSLAGTGAWQPVTVAAGVNATLYAVGASTSHSYAVGAQGTILQGNLLGNSFPTLVANVPTTAALRDFILFRQNTLIAVGDGGVILRSTDDGLHWALLTSPTTNDLRAIAVSGDGSYAIACGLGGVLLWTNDGSNWSASGASPLRADLFGATFSNGYFVVCGAQALVARAQPSAVGVDVGWDYTATRGLTWGLLKESFKGGR